MIRNPEPGLSDEALAKSETQLVRRIRILFGEKVLGGVFSLCHDVPLNERTYPY
jgi:hypothetical protein